MASRSTWTACAGDAGVRLDKFLADATRLGSRGKAAAALERAKISLNGREASPADAATRLAVGDVVELWADRPGSSRRRTGVAVFKGLRIVYEDDAMLVVNKPAGVLTVPLPRRKDAPSVSEILTEYLTPKRHERALVVHRIDRDTSGLVIFAKTPRALTQMKRQFERREPRRVYWAIVHGVPGPSEGVWRDTLVWDADELTQRVAGATDHHAREAVCRYRVLERFSRAALLEIELETGKRNQIRVQASRRGHMLLGEQQYVPELTPHAPAPCPRQALHARRLELTHPTTGTPLTFEAPLPPDLSRVLDTLRGSRQ